MKPKFWMVLGYGAPTYRHQTEEGARREAERLGRLNPGNEFTVLESIASVTVRGVSWTDHEEEDVSFPF